MVYHFMLMLQLVVLSFLSLKNQEEIDLENGISEFQVFQVLMQIFINMGIVQKVPLFSSSETQKLEEINILVFLHGLVEFISLQLLSAQEMEVVSVRLGVHCQIQEKKDFSQQLSSFCRLKISLLRLLKITQSQS